MRELGWQAMVNLLPSLSPHCQARFSHLSLGNASILFFFWLWNAHTTSFLFFCHWLSPCPLPCLRISSPPLLHLAMFDLFMTLHPFLAPLFFFCFLHGYPACLHNILQHLQHAHLCIFSKPMCFSCLHSPHSSLYIHACIHSYTHTSPCPTCYKLNMYGSLPA